MDIRLLHLVFLYQTTYPGLRERYAVLCIFRVGLCGLWVVDRDDWVSERLCLCEKDLRVSSIHFYSQL